MNRRQTEMRTYADLKAQRELEAMLAAHHAKRDYTKRKPNRRRSDAPSDLEQLMAAGWFWVGWIAVLAIGVWLVLPGGAK